MEDCFALPHEFMKRNKLKICDNMLRFGIYILLCFKVFLKSNVQSLCLRK